jgi:hypothetical protein
LLADLIWTHDTAMAGCPLTRVNHALAMNEEEIENHFNEIHDELQAYKKQLDSLKEDLK